MTIFTTTPFVEISKKLPKLVPKHNRVHRIDQFTHCFKWNNPAIWGLKFPTEVFRGGFLRYFNIHSLFSWSLQCMNCFKPSARVCLLYDGCSKQTYINRRSEFRQQNSVDAAGKMLCLRGGVMKRQTQKQKLKKWRLLEFLTS